MEENAETPPLAGEDCMLLFLSLADDAYSRAGYSPLVYLRKSRGYFKFLLELNHRFAAKLMLARL